MIDRARMDVDQTEKEGQEGKPLIVGLGKTGSAAQRFFERRGGQPLLYDDRRADCLQTPDAVDWSEVSCVVPSPGIPFDHPVVREAQRRGINVWSDIDLFVRAVRKSFPHAAFVGVTGTNGKSTTTALIGHLLKEHFPNVVVGGNIGTPVLDLPVFDATYVLELSSFQLAWSHQLNLDVAVWTNLTEDHLDRHGSMAAYIQAKERMFDGARESVMGIDDEPSREVFEKLQAQARPVKSVSLGEQASYQVKPNGDLFDEGRLLFNVKENSSLPGAHNAQNIALATAAVQSLGVGTAEIQTGLRTFKGLAHRIEFIRTQADGLAFVNDSKATNAASTIKALESFPDTTLYLIAGGRAKSDGLTPAIPFMGNVRKVFLIGEASDRFAEELQAVPKAPPFEPCGDLARALAQAVETARQDSAPCRMILFSPACASFDQFSNFEERGDVFRQLVLDLPERSEKENV